jgi:hypothetical protein
VYILIVLRKAPHAALLRLRRGQPSPPRRARSVRGVLTRILFAVVFLLGSPLFALGDPAGVAGGLGALLRMVAWFLGAWLVLSVVAALILGQWMRARARANQALSARIRHEDWLEAASAMPASGREPRR